MPPGRISNDRYDEIATIAKQSTTGRQCFRCNNAGNAVLAKFFDLLAEDIYDQDGGQSDNMFMFTLKKAARSVGEERLRVYDKPSLSRVKHVGPKLVGIVEKSLWKLFPPEEPSEEEGRLLREVLLEEKEAKKAAKKRSKQETEGGEQPTAEGDESRKKPKQQRAKKPYCPNVGTANYAFLILLYKSYCEGEQYLTKEELIRRAQHSGLSDKSIVGEPINPAGRGGPNPKNYYNGWSSFTTLRAKDPPLVRMWSNPAKICIASTGVELGKQLFEDAVSRGKMAPMVQPNTSNVHQTRADSVQGSAPTVAPEPAGVLDAGGIPSFNSIHSGGGASSSVHLLTPLPRIAGLSAEPAIKIDLLDENTPVVLDTRATGTEADTVAGNRNGGLGKYISPLPQNKSRHCKETTGAWQLPVLGSNPSGYTPRVPPLKPGQKLSQQYEIILLVDQREQFSRLTQGGQDQASRNDSTNEHIRRLESKGVKCKLLTLEQGDALWVAQSLTAPHVQYVLDWIVERKNVADLVQSIKSKRYEQQKYWISRCGLRHGVYLIEGDMDWLSDAKCARSASISTEVMDGYEVLRTHSIADTFNTYARLTKSLNHLFGDLDFSDFQKQQQQDNFEALQTLEEFSAKMSTMKQLTCHDVWGLLLTRVSGVGPDMATAILEQFPTPISLFRAYTAIVKDCLSKQKDPIIECHKFLAKIPISPFKTIGPSSSKQIFDVLFRPGWSLLGEG